MHQNFTGLRGHKRREAQCSHTMCTCMRCDGRAKMSRAETLCGDAESDSHADSARPTERAGAVCGGPPSQQSTHTLVLTLSFSSLSSLFLQRIPVLHSLLPLCHHPANNSCLLMRCVL